MSLNERLKQVIVAVTKDRTRYVELKEHTEISGDIWKNFWFGRREPDARMLEAVCRKWPRYAFWLVTGGTDIRAGHIAPGQATCFETVVEPSVTSTAFLDAVVELSRLYEQLFESEKMTPEKAERLASIIDGFMAGKAVHSFDEDITAFLPFTDMIFKRIKAFRQIEKIRANEFSMSSE